MQNLVFNRTDLGSIVPRPGVVSVVTLTFGGFVSPTAIVIAKQIGSYIYGIASTGRYSGKDEPFCFDTTTRTFVTVRNVLSTNVPDTVSPTGRYTPPTVDLIADILVFTHSGASGSNYIFWIDISNPASPTWNAGNTSVSGLPSVPIAVAQFNERAYYLCGNLVYFSDVLLPLQVTYPAQAIAIGSSTPGTALAGLPIGTTTQGVLAALIAFKDNSIWQITGDYALGTLAKNQISQAFGCSAPMTISPVMEGLAFMSQDGIRLVNSSSFAVSLYSTDVTIPFMNSLEPSRACAAYNNGVYRICLSTIIEGIVYNHSDYWYDIFRKRWTGPHTFGYDQVTPYGIGFLISSSSAPGTMLQSDVVPAPSTSYADNAVPYTCLLRTTNLSDTGEMAVKSIAETTIDLRVQNTSMVYSISAVNDNDVVLSSSTVTTPSATLAGNLWGYGLWGQGLWTATPAPYDHTFSVDWPIPVVYKKLNFTISVTASGGVVIERMFWREQVLGFTNLDVGTYTYIPPLAGALLLENGAYLVQENGHRILL